MRSESRRSLFAAAILATAFSALSCGREPTGPGSVDGVQLSQGLAFLTKFPDGYEELRREAQSSTPGAGDLVAFSKVRIILRNPAANNAIVREQTLDFTPNSPDLPVSMSVDLPAGTPASGLPLQLTLEYLSAAGAIVFTGGPAAVTAVPVVQGQDPPTTAPVTIPVRYSGPGSGASGIRFRTAPTSVDAGQTFSFVAEAIDAGGNPIPNVPILYSSSSPGVASINAASGAGTAGASRGIVSIEAKLLTGQAVTAQLEVSVPAAQISVVLPSGTVRPRPGDAVEVDLEVRNIEGDLASGRTMTFSTTDGSVSQSTVVLDQFGRARTTWTLGPRVGNQELRSTVDAISRTIVLRVEAPPPARLEFDQQPPTSVAAGSPFAPAVKVKAVDAAGAVTTAFAGKIRLALGTSPATGAALNGIVEVDAADGVATFTNLSINTLGAYTLVARANDLAEATSNPFSVVAGTPAKLRFRESPAGSTEAGRPLGRVSVEVLDALGNLVSTSTASIALTANGPTAASAGMENLPSGVVRVTPETGASANALSGTISKSASGGVAVFTDLALTRSGGYTLTASATPLTSVTGDRFTIAPGPATTLNLVSGDKQESPGGVQLAKPIVVRVTDDFDNGIGGVTVNFAPTAGHGSVNPVSAVTASDGSAQTLWTLAGTAGGKTLNVTSPSLVAQTLQVPATATTSSGTARTWTGTTSSAFNVATNWTPQGVPGSADQLTIPALSPAPVNTGTITVGSLSLAAGASLDNSGTITVNGSVTIAQLLLRESSRLLANSLGYGITGNGQLTLAGPAGSTLMGAIVNQIVVSGSYTLNGGTTVSNAFQVISGGSVTLSGFSLYLASDFYTVGTGKIIMTNPADYLDIDGNANFGGGSEHGFLTAGTLEIERNFTATGATFSAIGSHMTLFSGNNETTQNIAFTAPVAGRGFNHVRFENYDYKVFAGAPTIVGNVEIDGSSSPVTGAGVTVKIGGSLSDYTYVAYDTQGGWRVGTTDFFGSGTINSQFLTTDIIISGGTRQMAPYTCVMCELRLPSSRASVRTSPRSAPRARLLAGIADAGYAQLTGSILVTGASSVLDLNGTELYISGDFTTASGGRLKMTEASDHLFVDGSVAFGGGSTAGLLTAGELEVIGAFSQGGGAADAFAPTTGFYTYIGDPYCYYCGVRAPNARATQPDRGAVRQPSAADQARAARHASDARRFDAARAPRLARREARAARRAAALTARKLPVTQLGRRLSGLANEIAPSTISFANPGSSAFGHLYLQGNYYELNSDVNVLGRLETGGGYNFSLSSSSPRTVTSRGADVRELHFSNVRWVLLDGDAILALDDVDFTDMDPTVDQFTINRAGTELGGESSGYTLWYWYFGTTPTTGRYINAIDSDGAVPFVKLSMYSPTPATHGGKVGTSNGALIDSWPAEAALFTWTGATSTSWNVATNWSGGVVPTSVDDVEIPAAPTNQPVLNATSYAHNLTIAAGATIDTNCRDLFVYGNVVAALGANATVSCDGEPVYFVGDGGAFNTVVGRFDDVVITGMYRVSGPGNQLITSSGLEVSGGGNLTINGGRVDVGGVGGTAYGGFETMGSGTLTMTSPADQLFVGQGGAWFAGGSTAGLLTAGTITIPNAGLQTPSYATSAAAFAPSGTHTVVVGNGTDVGLGGFQFYDPASSFFQNVVINGNATMSVAANLTIKGTLSRGIGASVAKAVGAGRVVTVGGLSISGNPTTFNGVAITLAASGPAPTFNNVTFQGFTSFTGPLLDILRTSGGPFTFNALDFSAVTGLGVGGIFIRNSGTETVNIRGSNPGTGTLNVHFQVFGSGSLSWIP